MAEVDPAGGAVLDRSSSPDSRRLALRAAGAALAVALLYVAFRDLDPRRAARLVVGLGPAGALLLAPSLMAIVCETFAWQRAIATMVKPVAFWPLLRVRVASESLASVL